MPCCHLKRDLTRFLSDPFYGNVELVLTSHYSKCQCFVAIDNSMPNTGNEPGVVWLVCKTYITQRACFYGRHTQYWTYGRLFKCKRYHKTQSQNYLYKSVILDEYGIVVHINHVFHHGVISTSCGGGPR